MTQLNYEIDARKFQKITIEGTVPYEAFYLHDYYPKKHFGDVCTNIQIIRRKLYDFKDGNRTMLEDFKKITMGKDSKRDEFILMNIPASTQAKTTIRFEKFMKDYSLYLGVENGYGVITVIDHEELKGDLTIDRLQFFNFDEERYNDKKIILIDDVKTSGKTFRQIADKLIQTGANKVQGCFYCQTIDYRHLTDFDL